MHESLQTIDLLVAQRLLPHGSKEALLFLALLFKASREGKYYLECSSPLQEIERLSQKEHAPIVIEDGGIYLRKNYEIEMAIVQELKRIAASPLKPITLSPPPHLYPAQRAAFQAAFEHKLIVVTGGPGSGKTHLASAIIDAFISQFPQAKVIVTAPTGKAAFRIKHAKVTTKTLHALLQLKQYETLHQSKTPIICDLLLVDECSMIDAKLFKLLTESLLSHTRIILIGDPDQLPPIEAGPIFADLCRLSSLHVFHLNETKRTESLPLCHLAQAISQGRSEEVLHLLESQKGPLQLLPCPPSPPLLKDLKNVIITPYKHGPLGIDRCNAAHLDRPIKPIMITKNDYKLGLMNGEIGIIEGEKAVFSSDKEAKSYPLSLLSEYTYAFAISIHKSQGSEFDHVHLILPLEEEGYTREMIYTAATRAKKTLTIYADKKTLIEAINRKSQIASRIGRKLSLN